MSRRPDERAVALETGPDVARRLLMLLATTRGVQPTLPTAMPSAQWQALESLARSHRVLPLLHWRLLHERSDAEVPACVRDAARAAFQAATRRALVCQRILLNLTRLLDASGVPSLALKGAYLAYAVYPQPGLRPLRDLDVLVPAAQALAAHAALVAAGFTPVPGHEGDIATCLASSKHLPPLRAPDAPVHVELHVRLAPPGAGNGRAFDDASLWSRRIVRHVAGGAVGHLAPTDLLLHLIYHAAYDHRLDNGPLTLSDLDYLIRAAPIDWPLFWRQARDAGWTRGCLLLLQMTRQHHGDTPIEFLDLDAGELAQAALRADACAPLLLRASAGGKDAHLAALVAGRPPIEAWRLLWARAFARSAIAAGHARTDTRRGLWRAYAAKLSHLATVRLPGIARDWRRGDVRRGLREAAQLERWLAGR